MNRKGKKSASLRVSMKAKYFLIKQNPFTKYKFCKKKVEREIETEGKEKNKDEQDRDAEAYTAQMALKLTGNLTRKWNMLEHTTLHPRALGPRRELPLGCPTSAGSQSSALLQQRHSWSPPPWSPAPPTSAGGEGGNIEI